jgi:hypothetical protein
MVTALCNTIDLLRKHLEHGVSSLLHYKFTQETLRAWCQLSTKLYIYSGNIESLLSALCKTIHSLRKH